MMAKTKEPAPDPDQDPGFQQRVVDLDAMRDAGDLTKADHGLAVQRARGAVISGKSLPSMPKRSRQNMLDFEAARAQKKADRAERKETGMSRRDQQERDALGAAAQARDATLAHRRTTFDTALAEGRTTAAQHAEALSRLDMLAAQPVVPPQVVKQRSGFWAAFDSIDRFS